MAWKNVKNWTGVKYINRRFMKAVSLYLEDARSHENTFLKKYVLVMCRKLNKLPFVKAGYRKDLCEGATNNNRLHIG